MAMTQERKRDFTQHWSSIKPMILNVKPIFQWPFQEPIDWRYRFHIFLVYFSGLNFKIQDSQELSGANLESNHWIQDSIFQIPRNSLEQILNPTPGFKIQDSRFPGTLWSKSWIQPQDSRFKIPRNSLEQILNPTPGFKIQDSRFPGTLWSKSWIQPQDFKIQDSQELFGANFESNPRIQDSRFPGTLWSKSWIHLESWIQDFLQRVPGNLESWILDSRFAGKSPQESWILNPGNPRIQDSRFPGTLWSKSWIQPQDSRFKIPRNSLEQILNPSWILDSRFPAKSPWESWILNPGFKICWKESPGILNLESRGWIQDLDSRFAQKSLWESWILNPSNLQWHCNAIASWIGVKEVKAAKRSVLGGGTIFLCIYVNGGRDINGARQGKYMTIWYHMISFSACIQIPFPLTLRTSLLHLNSFWNEAE